jgi:hypothetical protein
MNNYSALEFRNASRPSEGGDKKHSIMLSRNKEKINGTNKLSESLVLEVSDQSNRFDNDKILIL